MKAIMRIKRHNWGLCTVFDWSEIKYSLYPDGSYTIATRDGNKKPIIQMSDKGVLPNSEFAKAKKLMNQFNNHEPFPKIDACDGEAFEITTYDEQGNIVGHRSLGYIYGIEVIEKLVQIFDSDYER